MSEYPYGKPIQFRALEITPEIIELEEEDEALYVDMDRARFLNMPVSTTSNFEKEMAIINDLAEYAK